MTRRTSHRGNSRETAAHRRPPLLPLAAAISAVLYGVPAGVHADENSGTLAEITVTAQKKVENLQDVPVSIQALDTQRLEQLHVDSFDDYVKYLPSVAFQSEGPGSASGGDGVHSGSLPSVGV